MKPSFDIQSVRGLSETEVAARIEEEGPNELPFERRRTVLRIALEVVREPMFLLLVACGALYLTMGEPIDAAMLLGFVCVVMGITIFQERRTERALDALRDLSSPRALVIRDGIQKRIPGREVVRGDMLILSEGDRVPADAMLLHAVNMSVDESLLTGESVPVRKTRAEGHVPAARPGGDDLPFVFSGTLVTAGQGVAEVLSTGARTELGRIGKALQGVENEETLLQKETRALVRVLAIVGLSLCGMAVLIYGITRGNTPEAWEGGLLAGITMAMATLPEEFPVVLTIFLALGAWRISRSSVLTRRMPAIETLGAATVLCTDKTGTLTLNRMTVRQLNAGGRAFNAGDGAPATLPEKFHALIEYGILASRRDPVDPMEKAMRDFGTRHLARTEHLHGNWTLVHEYPLSPELLALSRVWQSPGGGDFVIAAKGAPEAIADLCHLAEPEKDALAEAATGMANSGLRVLGVAGAAFSERNLPGGQHDFKFEFLGLVGLEDPVRPSAPAAIGECYAAGMRVIMITGDYPGTAQSIARQIGLKPADSCITGQELDAMGDDELRRRIGSVSIFARVVPEQKLRIVNALKANGEVVAMTGDGVNDAPALKAAHIGIAMGGRGTDVAREASALVLLDDDFASIVRAVKMGRRIYDNIRKAVSYILAVHVPIAGLSIIPMFFKNWSLLLLPVHVVFLELIIDPACSTVFEAEKEEPNVMRRPPRKRSDGLFNLRTVGVSILQGAGVLGLILGVMAVARTMAHPVDDSQSALMFTTLVIANLCLILANRSWNRTAFSMLAEPNSALWWVVGGAVTGMGLILNLPVMRQLFHFSAMNWKGYAVCAAAGMLSLLWFELLKMTALRQRTG